MTLYLSDDIKQYFQSTSSAFDQMMTMTGEVYRNQKGRITQRIKLGDKTYFIKQHYGVGWHEIFKNILVGRKPVLGAKNEWQALKDMQAIGIQAPKLVAYGQRGRNPAQRESFVLMEDVTPAISLEDYVKQWDKHKPTVQFKRQLIEQVATMARIMHCNGINHRDFYICHFLLRDPKATDSLCLIDLHRAAQHKHLPVRWVIKDLAGLYFSSKDAGLTTRDLLRFIKTYRNKSLRDILQTEQAFWQKVKNRGNKLYRDHQ